MDYRKIISFGKGGYVISIPKDWIVENDLKKGMPILVERNGPSLILSSRENSDFLDIEQSKTEMNIDGLPHNKITRSLIAMYLDSSNTITLYGKTLKNALPEIKKQVNELMALEIIESLKNKVILKDFLDFNSVSVEKTFRRMDMILRSMLSEVKERNPQIYENIIDRDRSINQHLYLILKITKKAARQPALAKSLKLNHQKGLLIWSISFIVEEIGDELKRLVHILKTAKLKKQTEDQVFKLFEEVEQSYLNAMKIFYKNNITLSFEEYDKNKEKIKNYYQIYQSQFKEMHLAVILEIFRKIMLLNNTILRYIYLYGKSPDGVNM